MAENKSLNFKRTGRQHDITAAGWLYFCMAMKKDSAEMTGNNYTIPPENQWFHQEAANIVLLWWIFQTVVWNLKDKAIETAYI